MSCAVFPYLISNNPEYFSQKMAAKCLHELVHEAAAACADKIAVTFDSSVATRVSLTYNEVISLANELSEHLRISIQKPDGALGLYCHADVFLPVWIMGVLQFPAACVPLDPASPSLCILRLMNKCRLNYCLIQTHLLHQFQSSFSNLLSLTVCATLSSHKLSLIKLKIEQDENIQLTETDQRLSVSAMTRDVHQGEPLAYILHTSGTTGLPKIVKVPHQCIVPNITHLRSVFQMTAEDVVFLSSPLTFDPSVVEMFLALSSGARLLIVPSAVKKMPSRLAHVLFKRNATTVLQATPTLVRRFGRHVLQEEVLSANSSLRLLAFGGEPCPSLNLLKSWRQKGNSTHICNLYGTTEVSCWASWYKVPETLLCLDDMSDVSVPLGEPMLDTVMEVRDETGCLVTDGEGQMFIGGQERVCLLDEEKTIVRGTMRATGDWVQVCNSHLYFLGRKDRLVKRFGQRVHLDALQQTIENLPQVEACVVSMSEGCRLMAFIVLASGQQRALPSSSTEVHGEHSTVSSENLAALNVKGTCTDSANRVIEGEIRQMLSQLLESHSIPDTILFIPALPLTSHGKVAMAELMRMCETQKQNAYKETKQETIETARLKLQSMWKECLGLADDVVVEEGAHFMLSGGDSLQALRLYDEITVAMGTTPVGLLEVILDGSFLDVLSQMMTKTDNYNSVIQPSKKRMREDSNSVVSPERHHKKMTTVGETKSTTGLVAPLVKRTKGFVVVRRAGEVIEWEAECLSDTQGSNNRKDNNTHSIVNASYEVCEITQNNSDIEEITDYPKEDCSGQVTETERSECSQEGSSSSSDVLPLDLRVLWSSDTGKCVDASAVLLVASERTTVFIGSHSHRLQALNLTNGEIIWERILGDRLESSAAISKCGSFVAVGCYDRQIYFLDVVCGDTLWTFKTGDVVKSCPSVDPKTGLVFAGSHDGYIYALDPLAKCCSWQHHCGGGAVFSSPCVHLSPRQLYCSTLGGHLCCLNPDSGTVLWTFSSGAPFFSSPNCSASCVFIGAVNGHIYGISHTGEKLWDFSTKGPVFSSPCVSSSSLISYQVSKTSSRRISTSQPAKHVVTCGSHDGHVYCLNAVNGSLLWKFQTTAKVFSSPFVFDGAQWGFGALVAVCSTDGTVSVLDGEMGTLKANLSLPGELFSSPVVWGQNVVIGCRNDYVYCLELSK